MTEDPEAARISELSADALSADALSADALDEDAASALADASELADASDDAASLLAAVELDDALSEAALAEEDPDDPQAHRHADNARTADKIAMLSNRLMKTPSLGLP